MLLPGCYTEYEAIPKQKIHQRTRADRKQIRHDIVELQFAHKPSHEEKVADKRDRPITDIKLGQPAERLHSLNSRPIRPCEAFMPQKIVDHRDRKSTRLNS